MRKQWNNPDLSELGVESTMTELPRDPGGITGPHTHRCICGLYFDSWAEAEIHMAKYVGTPDNDKHRIDVVLIS